MSQDKETQEFLDDLMALCDYYQFIFDKYNIDISSQTLQYDTMFGNRGSVPGMREAKLIVEVIIPE